jgi:hypothetical protein
MATNTNDGVARNQMIHEPGDLKGALQQKRRLKDIFGKRI